MSERDGIENRIAGYLRAQAWMPGVRSVRFLAAGEYNENYLVEDGSVRSVFRINRGSQLMLDDQISYEFRVLRALESSGVTPKPLRVDPDPPGFGGGVLLMEYLPGRPLDYRQDAEKAARIFAGIHRQPTVPGLIEQRDPVRDIVAESERLIERYPDHPRKEIRSVLLSYRDRLLDRADEARALFDDEEPCIVNTEVNSHNFLIGEEHSYLVDWEKAVVSCRYQDLGHFLVATSTLWKSDVVYTPEEKRRFLAQYRSFLPDPPSGDRLAAGTDLLERTILLRALAWCYMAFHEYACGRKAIRNGDTFRKIGQYLDGVEWFLR